MSARHADAPGPAHPAAPAVPSSWRCLEPGSAGWPSRLAHLSTPPRCLWLAGEVPPEECAVAVVGARRATLGGLEIAHRIGRSLVEAGIQVVSGLAQGIDAAAHRGALAGGGSTVAVLGCGIDVCHPPSHGDLRRQVMDRGCLLTEDPPGSPPERWRFPRRNRIIAALAHAVVVVEAAERSGALITARLAADLGREVFAVPGSLLSDRSAGTNRLLRDGAGVWLGVEDVLLALPGLAGVRPRGDRTGPRATGPPLDAALAGVLDLVGADPVHPDALAAALGRPARLVAAQLTSLEMLGRVREVAGGRVVRTAEGGR